MKIFKNCIFALLVGLMFAASLYAQSTYILPWATDDPAQNLRTSVAVTAGGSGAVVSFLFRDQNGYEEHAVGNVLKGWETKTFYPAEMLDPLVIRKVFTGSVTIIATAPVYPVASLFQFTDGKVTWATFQQFHKVGVCE